MTEESGCELSPVSRHHDYLLTLSQMVKSTHRPSSFILYGFYSLARTARPLSLPTRIPALAHTSPQILYECSFDLPFLPGAAQLIARNGVLGAVPVHQY